MTIQRTILPVIRTAEQISAQRANQAVANAALKQSKSAVDNLVNAFDGVKARRAFSMAFDATAKQSASKNPDLKNQLLNQLTSPVLPKNTQTQTSLLSNLKFPTDSNSSLGSINLSANTGVNANLAIRPFSTTAAVERETKTDELLNFSNQRGIHEVSGNDGARQAARALLFKERVVVCTGFNVGKDEKGNPLPETDGPPGAVILGESMRTGGAEVTYVVDETNAEAMRASLKVLNPEMSDDEINSFLHIFKAEHGTEAADLEAEEILKKTGADAIVGVELPGVNSEGDMLNMRGISVKDANLPIYKVLDKAGEKNVLRVTVGDGGNEVGSGNWDGVRKALNGKEMQAVTKADLAVKSSVSNFGALGIAALFMKFRGILGQFVTPEQYRQVLEAGFQSGLIDGVTRSNEPGTPNADGTAVTGVDGLSIEEHLKLLTRLVELVEQHEPAPADAKALTDICVFDSSNGALVAAKVLKAEFEKFGFNTNFAIVVDHDNAPYGQYTGDKEFQLGDDGKKEKVLYRLVSNGLKTGEELKAALNVMACNTACTVPEAMKDIDIESINLIDVTANAIVKHGGKNPVLIATPVTALASDYPDKVFEASNGEIDLRKTPVKDVGPNGEDGWANMIGAPPWAPMINKLEHLDSNNREMVENTVKLYVRQVPEDATSVWLCCTHYPEFEALIKKALDERNLGHIEVINPMKYQGKAASELLEKLEAQQDSKIGKNNLQGSDKVFTSMPSDKKSGILQSVDALFKPEVPVESVSFGQNKVTTFEKIENFKRIQNAMQDALSKYGRAF